MQRLLKSKLLKCFVAVCIIVVGFCFYTGYLYNNLDNSSPKEAISEFIYGETHSWKSFFIDIEEYDDVYQKNDDCLYYRIKYNGIYSIPGDLGGTIEVKKVDNYYIVTRYIGYC